MSARLEREKSIPFVKQSDPKSCGAACLSMIYKYYGQDIDEKQVFSEVTGADELGGENCRTYLMSQNAIMHGLHAMAFFANDIRQTIRVCRANDIELIILFHNTTRSFAAHFCVVNNVMPGGIYVKDPELSEEKERNIRFRDLEDLAKTSHMDGDNIHFDNTVIAVSNRQSMSNIVCKNPKCKHLIPVIDEIQDQINMILCPYCDSVFPL